MSLRRLEVNFFTFPEEVPKVIIIDVTVLSLHVVSNHTYTINEDK